MDFHHSIFHIWPRRIYFRKHVNYSTLWLECCGILNFQHHHGNGCPGSLPIPSNRFQPSKFSTNVPRKNRPRQSIFPFCLGDFCMRRWLKICLCIFLFYLCKFLIAGVRTGSNFGNLICFWSKKNRVSFIRAQSTLDINWVPCETLVVTAPSHLL